MVNRASRFEIFVDSLIPFALLSLVAVTLVELSFARIVKKYGFAFDVIEVFTIGILMFDLYFKYKHAKSIPNFLAKYWLYILAVFPFFLVVRLLERLASVHIIAEESPLWIKQLAIILKESRLVRFSESFQFLGRFSRLIRAFYFYENPRVRHKINIAKLLGLKRKKKR